MSATGTPAEKNQKNRYKGTLNLPKTSFPMKANLVQNESASLKRWKQMDLYNAIREKMAGAERFVFHDGPPYANGSIHLGHLMNKCLKDFVVRSKTMMGFDCPFVPGWDCHGLPIEHKVMTELVESGKAEKLNGLAEDTRRMAVRRECEKYAHKFHKLHTEQMTRLLTLADYEHPYLTLHPHYEGATLEVLSALIEQGLVYRALKPVHWSIANETALAEAELEYEDREDISVYVDFEAADKDAVYKAFGVDGNADVEEGGAGGVTPSFMIWTTTPWTLPANLAIAVNPKFSYALVRVDGNVTVLAEDLIEKVTQLAKSEQVEVLATTSGEKLLGLRYVHPFIAEAPRPMHEPEADTSRCYTVLPADYVTLEDGTGLVHTAPGHGTEDYQTGLREGLPVYCPVLGDGRYDTTAPEWLQGHSVWDANEIVTKRLRDSGHLYYDHRFMHSYPHDWRSKTPVIFRSTDQWFISVHTPTKRDGKDLRELALGATASGVDFVPAWGKNRMRGMLESRPDWCVSRQRAWGLPIPAFYTPEGQTLMTAASTKAVATLIREKGSDAWFELPAEQLLAHYDPSADPDAPEALDMSTLKKGSDIFDVWFESGSSWNAVMRERFGDEAFPVDLYLEGSDQHRGWFQLSLLPALGMMGEPPFKEILTHGFMVNKDGKKLSKSSGDTVEDLFRDYGVDVLRWWVCSLSYENDVKVDRTFFDQAGESYRKVRNTLRFMLSNLDDFTPTCDGQAGECVDLDAFESTSIDAWVLGQYNSVATRVLEAYERYDFRSVHNLLYNFCNDTLSSVYLAAVKDRLYCDAKDSQRRKHTQTTLWELVDGLARLLAPVMCHTADEAFRALWKTDMKDTSRCVHLERFIPHFDGLKVSGHWGTVMEVREHALLQLEKAKEQIGVENPLDAALTLPDPERRLEDFDLVDLADLLGVSEVRLNHEPSATYEVHDLRDRPRCERSWKRDGTVKQRSDGGMLSDRDAKAIGVD